MKLANWAFSTLLVVLPAAHAACPAGIPSAGNPMCAPPTSKGSPYYVAPGSEPVGPRYEDRWGALAIGMVGSGGALVAFSFDALSKRDARRMALERCRALGGEKCRIDSEFRNGCGAVAAGRGGFVPALGPTAEVTASLAMERCENELSGCRVTDGACSFPVLVE